MVKLANIATGQAIVNPFIHADTHSELNPPILIADIDPDIINAIVTEDSKAESQNCFLLIHISLFINELFFNTDRACFDRVKYINFINDKK